MKELVSSSSSSERNSQHAGAHSGLVHPLGGTPNPVESAPSVEVRGQAPSQSVLDSICDAETLQMVANSLADHDDAAYGVWTLLEEASVISLFSVRWSPTRCAHAAFSACPELRG